MRKTLPLLALLFAVAPCRAAEIELALSAGVTLPFYSQHWTTTTVLPPVSIPGLSLVQDGTFGLEASGGSSFGAALGIQLAGPLGLELRVDDAAIELTPTQPSFRLQLTPPLPPVDTSLSPQGSVVVDRVTPISLNLRLRTGGRVRLGFSAGVSYLPSFSLLATERLSLPGVSVAVSAGGTLPGRFGGNAGVGLSIALAPHVALLADARGFGFVKTTLEWSGASTGAAPIDALLLQQLQKRLSPIEFNPGFFQATAGLAVRF